MADLTRGITFQANDEVTDAEMEQLIESATVSNIVRADMSSTDTSVSIGTAAPTSNPTPVAGHLWYNTTDGILMEYDGSNWKAVSRGVNLTNRSGGALSSGDVVVIDTGNANSVTTSTTVSDADAVGVVITGGADAASIVVITEGYCPKINVTGSTVPGDYLAISGTAKKADSFSAANQGTFARAISTSATNVKGYIGGAALASNAAGFEVAVADTVNFSKSTGTPSGTTVVSHGLGRIPSLIQFNGYFNTGQQNCFQGWCALQDSSTTKQIFSGSGESSNEGVAAHDYCCAAITSNANYMRGQLTAVTATNFTITWSEVGTVAKTFTVQVVATLFA